MAVVPRMRHEGWPAWTKAVFTLATIALIVVGILQIIQSRHGEWVLGLISIIAGAVFFIGLQIWPKWINDPS